LKAPASTQWRNLPAVPVKAANAKAPVVRAKVVRAAPVNEAAPVKAARAERVVKFLVAEVLVTPNVDRTRSSQHSILTAITLSQQKKSKRLQPLS